MEYNQNFDINSQKLSDDDNTDDDDIDYSALINNQLIETDSEKQNQSLPNSQDSQDIIPATQNSNTNFQRRFLRPYSQTTRTHSIPNPKPTTPQNRKRKGSPPKATPKKKPLFDTMDDILLKLALIDPHKTTAIYEYLDRYNSDPVVRYYLELLLEIQIIPILPSLDVIDSWSKNGCNINIPEVIGSELVSKCMDYFQTKLFNTNVKGAIAADKCLFNPKNNFNIPQFKLLPESDLEEMTTLKKDYVSKVQKQAEKGTTFVTQLLLLKIFQTITSFISDQGIQRDQKMIEYIFGTIFGIALVEYKANRPNLHVIDWSQYRSKTTDPKPSWRKMEPQQIPEDIPNRLAVNAIKNIHSHKIELDGKIVADEVHKLWNNEPTYANKLSNTIRGNYQRGRGKRYYENRSTHYENPNSHFVNNTFRGQSTFTQRGRGKSQTRGQFKGRGNNSRAFNSNQQRHDSFNGHHSRQPSNSSNSNPSASEIRQTLNTFI